MKQCISVTYLGALVQFDCAVTDGQLEGINNKIKLINQPAFGYRDTDNFFLKIKAAFPGNP